MRALENGGAEVVGGHARIFFEHAVEICRIFNPHHLCDFAYFDVRLQQKLFCFFYAARRASVILDA